MCLSCGAGGMVLPPSDTALNTSKHVKITIGITLATAVLFFISSQWMFGLIDLVIPAIGYMAIKNPEGFNVQQVMCFTVASIIRFVWGLVSLIAFTAGATDITFSDTWREHLYFATLCISLLNYFVSAYLMNIIYTELRFVALTFVAPPAEDSGAGPFGGFGRMAFPAPGNAQVEEPVPAVKPQGFKAFQGKGRRLDA